MGCVKEIAWAAGLFEGEGSIVCNKIQNRPDSYRTTISMSSCDRDVLERFVRIIGRGKVLGPYTNKIPTRKDKFDWAVQNYNDCLYVLGLLYPYLGLRRREKADEFIDLALSRWYK